MNCRGESVGLSDFFEFPRSLVPYDLSLCGRELCVHSIVFAEMNCSHSLLWPNEKPCGAYGECVGNVCVCQEGFSSFGDFSLLPDNPCDINVTAIIVLWAGVVVVAILNLGAAFWGFASRGMKLPIHAWRGWSMSLLSFVQSALLFGIAIPKIILPTEFIVGKSLICTLVHGSFITASAAHLFIAFGGYVRANELSQLARLGPDLKRKYQQKIKVYYTILVVLFIFSIPIAFMPVVLVYRPDLLQVVAAVHGLPLCCLFISLGAYLAPKLLGSMLKVLSVSLDADTDKKVQLRRIAFKLRVIRIVAILSFPVVSAMIVVVMFWPYLTIKVGYLLPFFFGLGTIATVLAIWGAITTATNAIRRPSLPFFGRLLKFDSSPYSANLKKMEPLQVPPSPPDVSVDAAD